MQDWTERVKWLSEKELTDRNIIRFNDNDHQNVQAGTHRWAEYLPGKYIRCRVRKGQPTPFYTDDRQRIEFVAWREGLFQSQQATRPKVAKDKTYQRRATQKSRIKLMFRNLMPHITDEQVAEAIEVYYRLNADRGNVRERLAVRVLMQLGFLHWCPLCSRPFSVAESKADLLSEEALKVADLDTRIPRDGVVVSEEGADPDGTLGGE